MRPQALGHEILQIALVASASPFRQTSQTGFHLNDLTDKEVAILRELVKEL